MTITTNESTPNITTVGTVHLTKHAQDVLAELTLAEKKTVQSTEASPYIVVMQGEWKTRPQTVDLAVMMAGIIKEREGESTIHNFIENMKSRWGLSLPYLKGMRAAVKHILEAEDRALARGSDTNVIDSDDFKELCNYALTCLRDENEHNPTMFHKDGKWYEIREDVAVPLDIHTFEARLNLVTNFRTSVGSGTSFKGVNCPTPVVKQVFNHIQKPVPILKGVIRSPMFNVEGDLINTRGYDRSGYFYAPPKDLFVPTPPRNITEAELFKAHEVLVDALCDFSLDGVSREDLENAVLRCAGEKLWGSGTDSHLKTAVPPSFLSVIGFMMEQLLRPMIDGPVMPLLVSKTVSRAGGGLLAAVIQQVVRGASDVRPVAQTEEERRKAIVSALRSGTSIIVWDNLSEHRTLDSPSMATLFTEGYVTDRLLGASEEITLSVSASFMLVGNRPAFSKELTERLTLAELIPQTDSPATRSGWKHEQLLPYVKENRAEILGALLVLIQNWINLGKPAPKYAPTIGRFESYTSVIGGILECAGENWTSWQGNRDKLKAVAEDTEESAWPTLFDAWVAERGTGERGKITVNDLIAIATELEIDLPVMRIKGGAPFAYVARSFGKVIASMNERVFALADGSKAMLVRSDKRTAGGVAWTLKPLAEKAAPVPTAKPAPIAAPALVPAPVAAPLPDRVGPVRPPKPAPVDTPDKPVIFGRTELRAMTPEERSTWRSIPRAAKAELKRELAARLAE